MFTLEGNLLTKKFSSVFDSSYPEQEVYPKLPDDVEGEWQPLHLGTLHFTGTTFAEWFITATPTLVIDPGLDQGDGNWRRRKFKICQKIRNPETGHYHGLPISLDVLRYQNQVAQELTLGTNYELVDSNTQIDMLGAAVGELQHEAELRVIGGSLLDDPVGTFTGVADANGWAIEKPWDIIHLVFVCILQLPTSALNLATFTKSGFTKQGVAGTLELPDWLSSPASHSIRAYIDSQTQVQEFVETLAFSFGHRIVVEHDGRYALRPIETTPNNETLVVTDGDISNFEQILRLDSFANRINVKYSQVPAGEQQTRFRIGRRKRKRKRREKITLETGTFLVKQNSLKTDVNGTIVHDDLLEALGQGPKEREILTYWVEEQVAGDLAEYTYLQSGRGAWWTKLNDINGTLSSVIGSDLVLVHRNRSAHGDISDGKLFRIIDANVQISNNNVRVEQADEVHR